MLQEFLQLFNMFYSITELIFLFFHFPQNTSLLPSVSADYGFIFKENP